MKLPTTEQVLTLLRTGTPDERVAFVKRLPPTELLEAAIALISSSNPGMVVVALGPAALKYCYGFHPEWGAVLAAALHERAVELWQTVSNHMLIPTTLSGLAGAHVKALSLLGRSAEVLDATARYIPFYEKLGEPENLPSMKVLRIEALLNLKRIDEAEAALREPALLKHPIAGIEARRLKGWVDRYRADPTRLPSEHQSSPSPPSSRELLEVLNTAIGIGFEGETGNQLKEMVAGLDPGNRLDPNNPEHYKKLGEILNQGERFLTGGDEQSEIAVRGKIRNASSVFVHGTPEPDVIDRCLADLRSSLDWAQKHGVTELVNDAIWGMYLCHSRLKQPSAAADALIQLRTSLESTRAGMKDPLKRGGVFGTYRYLFNSLCENLQKSGRAEDLLTAIESSKGRVIADRLTSGGDGVVADKAIYSAVARLPELARRERFHYLSFFVDEACVYAAFVSKAGKVYAIDPVAIASQELRDAATHVDPRLWVKAPLNISTRLAPLVAWLDGLLTQGVVAKGDHICYSADDDSNNIPLHYLGFRGGLLLDWFSVSRVHSAFHLDRVLSRKTPARFEQFAGFVVPLKQDLEKRSAEAFVANLDAPWKWLHDHGLQGHAARLAEATIERVIREPLDHRIVHFATHGWFPKDQGNPFRDSFLLLADSNGLPDGGRLREHKGKLTPSSILDAKLNLEESHISLMACVSGLAKEGIAGDTLGLDWAFIQSGAASLISTHWDISAASAARFFTLFYDKWIDAKLSRAAAFRATMLELLNGDQTPKSLQQWSAFSLTGDFR